MAKVRGPLLSLSARGQIAQSQVYATWRGVPYSRVYAVPANPRTTAQQSTRNVFTSIDDQWKHLFALSRAPWEAAVVGRPLVARNQLMRSNIPVLRGETDMLNWVASPGANGGLGPVNLAIAPNANPGELEFTVTCGKEPTGWTLEAVVAHAFLDRDPATRPTDFATEDENVTPVVDGDTTITLDGLTGGSLYIGAAWTRWTRPDGVTAYGISLTDSATPAS